MLAHFWPIVLRGKAKWKLSNRQAVNDVVTKAISKMADFRDKTVKFTILMRRPNILADLKMERKTDRVNTISEMGECGKANGNKTGKMVGEGSEIIRAQ